MIQTTLLMICLVLGEQKPTVPEKPTVVEKPVVAEVPVVKVAMTDDQIAKAIQDAIEKAAIKKQEIPWESIIEFLKWAITAIISVIGGKIYAMSAIRRERGPSREEVDKANKARLVSEPPVVAVPTAVPVAPVAVAPIPTVPATDTNAALMQVLKNMEERLEKLQGATK